MDEKKVTILRKMVRETRLKVKPGSEEQLARDVVELLHNVDILADVEVGEGIQRLTLSPEALRADEPEHSITRNEVFKNAPDARDGFIVVPRVLPGEDETNV